MHSLPKPTLSAEEVFKLSISKVSDLDLKSRLEACIPVVVRDSMEYDVKAVQALLHQIPKSAVVNGNVTGNEMIAVYEQRMVNKNGPGRPYYEQLRKPTDDDNCPFCGQLPIKTLDHYLAKTDYPSLVVSPSNLVPACRDCNSVKNATSPTKSEEAILHPYFDNIDNEQWLFARVLRTSPASLSFYIDPPSHASSVLAERVKYHFRVFQLNTLYKSEAATEFRNISFQMRKLLKSGGSNAVKQQLLDRAESSLQVRLNSWRTAMYQALAQDKWYCSEGAAI